MGWNVGFVKSTVELTEQCALELEGLLSEEDKDYYGMRYAIQRDGKWYLNFNHDHQEHIDGYLDQDDVNDVLLRHKINGEVRFATVENDTTMWEHRYVDGEHEIVSINLKDVAF